MKSRTLIFKIRAKFDPWFEEDLKIPEMARPQNYDYSFEDFMVAMQSNHGMGWIEDLLEDTYPEDIKELLKKTFEAGRRSIHNEGSIVIGESDEEESGDGVSSD